MFSHVQDILLNNVIICSYFSYVEKVYLLNV